MSKRDRERPISSQPKLSSKSSKRGATKSRRSVPPTSHVIQQRRDKPKACTARYRDHGYTSDKNSMTGMLTSSISPYDTMKAIVEKTISKEQVTDFENMMKLNLLNRTKSPKGDDSPLKQSESQTNGGIVSPRSMNATDQEQQQQEKENNNYEVCGEGKEGRSTSRQAGVAVGTGMAGNEDDEEYQMEEEEAERIMSQSQGLEVVLLAQEMNDSRCDGKKTLTDRMRELQVSVMEKAAKDTEPRELLKHFHQEGFFAYNYDEESRAYSPNGGGSMSSNVKKDNLYVIIGLSRKNKNHE